MPCSTPPVAPPAAPRGSPPSRALARVLLGAAVAALSLWILSAGTTAGAKPPEPGRSDGGTRKDGGGGGGGPSGQTEDEVYIGKAGRGAPPAGTGGANRRPPASPGR